MFAIIICYVAFLMLVGILDSFKVKTFRDFSVAGKSQKFFPVLMSLLATVLGASATVGIADKVSQIGFAAFWWLGVGALGLFLQAVFLSKKIRALDADTLPDLADKVAGNGAKKILAFIIAISWVGIIAAQFVSMVKIMALLLPGVNTEILLVAIAGVVILYTMFGGQLSVLRTDLAQTIIIFVGILATFIYTLGFTSVGEASLSALLERVSLVNENFGVYDIVYLLFIVGGAYFLGPDILSRNFVSKNGKVAQTAAATAAATLVFFSLVITLISLWGVVTFPDLNGKNPLLYIMTNVVPYPLAVLLCVSLVSALLSSADTCLINAASIVEHDILNSDKIQRVRFFVLSLGALAWGIAFFKTDIIGLLTGVYSIYVPGIVCPLGIAILFHKKRMICKSLWFLAVVFGGGFGFLQIVFGVGPACLPLVGMGVSLMLGLLSVILTPKASAVAPIGRQTGLSEGRRD